VATWLGAYGHDMFKCTHLKTNLRQDFTCCCFLEGIVSRKVLKILDPTTCGPFWPQHLTLDRHAKWLQVRMTKKLRRKVKCRFNRRQSQRSVKKVAGSTAGSCFVSFVGLLHTFEGVVWFYELRISCTLLQKTKFQLIVLQKSLFI